MIFRYDCVKDTKIVRGKHTLPGRVQVEMSKELGTLAIAAKITVKREISFRMNDFQIYGSECKD